ncbi:MAG: response regulator [Candidatus Omnitrophica bacterium]|nr:response regulator [Candidatus Omnitrophota bacterium]MCF7878817.1 response regulator [Candidatus Omnitrophota bacterium]MCF7893042.1 response regulator [Candidatus Omnitrophota bacterium]
MSKKILICDDEPDLAQVVAMSLKARGYQVLIAVDGMQSITLAHREKPDLILLDVKMPAGGGYIVYENLKKSTDTMLIPVIFFSALPARELKEKVEKLGAAGYLTKPHDSKELILKIEKALRQSGPPE